MILRRKIGSCVLKVSAVNCQFKLSIDTLNQHPGRYSINILIDTRLTLDRHLINSWSIVWQAVIKSHALIEGYMCLTLDQMLTEMLIKCQLSIDWLPMEYVDREYLLRLSIITWPRMPLVSVMYDLENWYFLYLELIEYGRLIRLKFNGM